MKNIGYFVIEIDQLVQDHSGTEQNLYQAEAYSGTSAGGGDQLSSVGEDNLSQYVAENGSSFEVSQVNLRDLDCYRLNIV